MSQLVNAALQQVKVWAQRKTVSLKPELDNGGGTVYADREQTLRVLVNLLSNAVKNSRLESVVSVWFNRCRPGVVHNHRPGTGHSARVG